MHTLEEKDYPEEVNAILRKIVCTDKKFTDIDVDVAVLSVDARVTNAKSHHFRHILERGDDSLTEHLKLIDLPQGDMVRVPVDLPSIPFRAMYLSNLTKGEDKPALIDGVQQALYWATREDKARIIGFEILGSLKKEVRYPLDKAIDVMGKIIIEWLTTEDAAPIDRIVFFMTNNPARAQLAKALKELAKEIISKPNESVEGRDTAALTHAQAQAPTRDAADPREGQQVQAKKELKRSPPNLEARPNKGILVYAKKAKMTVEGKQIDTPTRSLIGREEYQPELENQNQQQAKGRCDHQEQQLEGSPVDPQQSQQNLEGRLQNPEPNVQHEQGDLPTPQNREQNVEGNLYVKFQEQEKLDPQRIPQEQIVQEVEEVPALLDDSDSDSD